jgi:hypothetical protein
MAEANNEAPAQEAPATEQAAAAQAAPTENAPNLVLDEATGEMVSKNELKKRKK